MHPNCFPILHVRKVYFEALFHMFLVSMLRIGCYVKQMKWIKFINPSSVIHMGHKWILVRLLIFIDWYKHSNTNVSGSRCILNRFWCIIWRPKLVLIKMSTLQNELHNKFWLYIFLFSLVLNLACIGHSLCQIWSVYVHYLWGCDFSNKCVFLVLQQAEVLLNFFGECMHHKTFI